MYLLHALCSVCWEIIDSRKYSRFSFTARASHHSVKFLWMLLIFKTGHQIVQRLCLLTILRSMRFLFTDERNAYIILFHLKCFTSHENFVKRILNIPKCSTREESFETFLKYGKFCSLQGRSLTNSDTLGHVIYRLHWSVETFKYGAQLNGDFFKRFNCH